MRCDVTRNALPSICNVLWTRLKKLLKHSVEVDMPTCNLIHTDSLHVTSHCGHFHIRPFGCRHVGGQKCIVVIERKALNVSLLTNASDYSNKTCMDRSACLYLTNDGGFAGIFTCVGEQRYDYHLSLNHRNTFLTPNEVAAKQTYMEVSKCDVTLQMIYCFTPHLYSLSSAVTSSMRRTDMHHIDYPETWFVLQYVLTNFHLHTSPGSNYIYYLLSVIAVIGWSRTANKHTYT